MKNNNVQLAGTTHPFTRKADVFSTSAAERLRQERERCNFQRELEQAKRTLAIIVVSMAVIAAAVIIAIDLSKTGIQEDSSWVEVTTVHNWVDLAVHQDGRLGEVIEHLTIGDRLDTTGRRDYFIALDGGPNFYSEVVTPSGQVGWVIGSAI